MSAPIWTARCKSGYEFPTGRKTRFLRRPIYKACNRMCSRGELLCGDCATAEAIHEAPHAWRLNSVEWNGAVLWRRQEAS